MPANDVSINIEAEDRSRQAFRQAEQSIDSLERQTRELQGTTRATASALGLSGNAARETTTNFTSLGRQIFNTQEEAKRLGGVFRSLDGRLRESNGRFVKGREAVQDWGQAAGRATRGTGILTTSIGNLGGVLSGLAIAVVTQQIGRFAVESVKAAAQLEQLERGLKITSGSATEAAARMNQLIQVANRPGLQLNELVNFNNRLSAIGLSAEDIDKILLTTGQTIVSLGGNSHIAGEAVEQLTQAFQAGRVSLQDFRSIAQRIPGFYQAIADVHDVGANIEGLREAFNNAGGSLRDVLIPVMDELARRFEAPPDDSYVVAMDSLENAFLLTQAAIGDLFLPTITDAAFALSGFLEAVRAGIKDVSLLPEPIQDIVAGAKDLYDSLLEAASSIANNIGPEMREFAASLGTLLGSVLDLAGSIVNVLEPAFQLWSHVQAIIVGLITKLAQDITGIIGVLTDFVDWVSSAWREEERFVSETERVTEAIENVSEATKKATTSTQEYQSSLLTILRELESVNAELEQKKARLKELEEEGLTPADASMAQIVRRIALLEERSKSLSSSLPDLNQALEGVNEQLEDKKQRLAEMRGESEGASASAQQLQRQIANLTALASLLNVQIAQTTTELTEVAPATDTATEAIENYSLTLARLKATAEDAKDTLSDTINFQKLGANYQAAIAESDAYYDRQIANAKETLAQAEANSDEYFKIETNIFNLQRERQEARKKLTEQASKVGETEAERRVEIAEKENERLRGAGEETARALEASEKRRTAAAEAEQKRLTQVHEDNLKQREEAERASNERSLQDSEERLSALSNAFENAVPEAVDRSYQNIQQATVAHYETLKNQARQRITDEDALNAELVSLDRQRNAALENSHRNYLQRIASDAKNLLGERTDAFKTASDDILHNWERTVSDFERQLREADTEDALRAIESDFETAQQQMLASLESVLTELGFTAEQAAEIMKEILRTAEGEADGFADKVISAFKRLGKEADRETKRQNREIERNYRELVSEIEHILSNITDFFIEITRGGDIEDAFRQLGERVAESFLDVFTRDLSENLAASLSSIASETDLGGAAASGGTGAGGAIQAAGGLSSILSLITSSVALAAIVPAVVFATTKYIGDKVGQTGVIDNPNRQGRPLEDNESRRRRGETQSSYDRRLQANADAEAAIAERETFFGNYDPRAPFGRAIQETGIFTGNSGYFAESALRQTDVDIFGRVDLPGLVEDLEGLLQTRVEGLGTDMERAAAALESATGADLKPALSEYFTATTDFYQTQIDFANFVRRTTGHLDFGDVEGLSRQLQESLNQARLQDTSTNLTLFGIQRGRREAQSLAERTGTDRQFTEDTARAQYGDVAYDAEVAAAGELSEAAAIAPVIDRINEAIFLINASILSVETQIDQSNDPAEIAELLLRVPALIAEKYAMLRQALEERLNASEISVDVYNASLSELNTNESREIERHSDAVLANVVRGIDADIGLIDASITDIETQIAGLSDPEAIAELLSQIPGLLTEKYQLLRDALDAKYGGGEISVDVYNTSLSVINSREASDIERQSDAVLAQTLGAIDDDVALIDANIGALQLAVENTDDPDAVAGLLDAIKLLVMDKYTRLRERLDALLAAEEISQTAFDAATTAIGTAESRELAGIDAQGLSAISEAAQEQVSFINGAIGNLRTSLELTDDPAETQQILEAIRVLIGARFDILRAELEAIRETLSPEEYQQAFEGLNLAERLAFSNLDTEVFSAISAAAQMQVDFINGGINNLRLSLQLTDDPAELEQILNSIKVLVGARFDILIQELKDIEESLDPAVFAQALEGLEIGKLVGIQNIDTEITTATTPVAPRASVSRVATEIRNIALETAERQTHFIDGTLDNLRTSLALTDDPAEIQSILDTIKTLTSSRFDSLRAELEAIRNTLSSEEYNQALTGLNIGETLALRNIDTEKFAAISAEAQSQVDFLNGSIENLRTAFELTDDPAERQAILDAIKIILMQRFTILRTELENIRESLSPEDYEQALKGLNLGEQLTLENLDTEKFAIISAEAQAQVDFINKDIENLRTAFQLTDDPAERQQILDTIKILTQARFDILREELEAIRDRLSPEEYEQALKGLNLGETLALENLDTEKFGVISAAAQKQVDFVNGAIRNLELAFQLTDDPAEAQQILDAIKILVAKRFEILIEELKAIEDSFDDPALFTQALTGLQLGSQVALKGIDDRSIGITLEGFTGRISETDADIASLFDDLTEQTTASGINSAVNRLRTAIQTKYDLIRERIEASAENEETQAEQIAAVNVQEAGELQRLGEQGLGAFDSLINTAQFLLDNATEAEFGTRRQALIDAINTFYDERIAFINGLDLTDTDRRNMLAVVDIQRNIAVDAIPQMHQSVTERLELERELQADIKDLRDREVDNEADRQQSLQDLAEAHQDRLTDIERDGLRRREDLQREFSRDFADNIRNEQEQIAELLSGEGFDTREIQRFLQGFEGDVRGRLDADALSQLNEIQREGAIESIDLRRERDRDLEDIGIREGRQGEDAQIRLQQQTEDINAEAEATATALTASLAPLLETQATLVTQQQETAMREETTAARVSETAGVESNVAARRSEITAMEAMLQEQAATNIEMFGMGVERFFEVGDLFLEVGDRLTLSADRLDISAYALTQSAQQLASVFGRSLDLETAPGFAAQDAVSLQPDIDTELAMAVAPNVPTLSADIVNINTRTVNVAGGDVAGGVSPQTPTRPVEISIQHNQPVQIDGQTLGRIVDEVLVRLDTNGGTVGSYVRRDT